MKNRQFDSTNIQMANKDELIEPTKVAGFFSVGFTLPWPTKIGDKWLRILAALSSMFFYVTTPAILNLCGHCFCFVFKRKDISFTMAFISDILVAGYVYLVYEHFFAFQFCVAFRHARITLKLNGRV